MQILSGINWHWSVGIDQLALISWHWSVGTGERFRAEEISCTSYCSSHGAFVHFCTRMAIQIRYIAPIEFNTIRMRENSLSDRSTRKTPGGTHVGRTTMPAKITSISISQFLVSLNYKSEIFFVVLPKRLLEIFVEIILKLLVFN